MSEYQYYEFRTIDRPLDQDEMDELRELSTRAEITATSFTNTYHWGDFKGDPRVLMHRYFDAFIYVANWGTHRLMFRLPRRLLDVRAADVYCDEESLTLDAKKDHVVLEFRSEEEEPEDWDDGEPWMPALIPLRDELLRGDFRALYLGWLATLPRAGWEIDEDDDRREPSVPPGLAKLSGPLRSLAEFLRVEDELIEAAAQGSDTEPPAGPTRDELARWIKGLPASAKDAYLVRLLTEAGGPAIRTELSHRFREEAGVGGPGPAEGRSGPSAARCSRPATPWSRRRRGRPPSAPRRSGRGATASRPRHGPSTSTPWPAASRRPGARSMTSSPRRSPRNMTAPSPSSPTSARSPPGPAARPRPRPASGRSASGTPRSPP